MGSISANGKISTSATNDVIVSSGTSTSERYIQLSNTSGNLFAGPESSAGNTIITGAASYSTSIRGSNGINFSANNGSNIHTNISTSGVFTINNLGTGAVQSTAGVLSVISDSKGKDLFGRLKCSATSLLMKIPLPQGWAYNYKSGLPERAFEIKQFGLLADSVHYVLGEEFAPTQPQSKSDSIAGIKNYGLSDRALLSLTIQALQEANKKIDDLEMRVIKLEKMTVSASLENYGIDKIPVSSDTKKKAQYPVFDKKTGVAKVIKK